MIKFINNNNEKMDLFVEKVKDQIIEMVSRAITPDDCSVEEFYEMELEGIEVIDNTVIFDCDFNIDQAFVDDGYDLGYMAHELKKLYPDIEIFGVGSIDYHYSGFNYILICHDDKTVFANNEDDGLHFCNTLVLLSEGYTIDEISEYDEDIFVEKLYNDINKFLTKNQLNLTAEELLDKLDLEL